MHKTKTGQRVLVIEPYFGGSHKLFLEGLMSNVPAEYRLLTLPARKWKMRMQLAAPWVAQQISNLNLKDRCFDTVLCSTFIDVAVLRSILPLIDGWNNNVNYCTYFHENQFAYPGQYHDNNIQQFQYINLTTALSSDRIAFNSAHNRETFIAGCKLIIRRSSDIKLPHLTNELEEKSIILPPGMNYYDIDDVPSVELSGPPVIVWNHRWEHDKNPDLFFSTLSELKKKGHEFRLIVLGQSFDKNPSCFENAKSTFTDNILHFGFARSRAEYASLLKQGNIVVSTALHEFFGISILEGVRAGCIPVLPDRLSYPELFPKKYLYTGDTLEHTLEKTLYSTSKLSPEESEKYTDPYSWSKISNRYCNWLFN